MLQGYPTRSTTPDRELHEIRIQGAGTSQPVNESARGVAVTRTATGIYLITWSEDPGAYVAAIAGIEAATPGDVAGHVVIMDTYNATARTQSFVLYNASNVAHDLAANEYITIFAAFKRTDV